MVRKRVQNHWSVLDQVPEACEIIDFDWHCLYVNDAAASYYHQPKEELLGRTKMQICPGIEETQLFAELQHCLRKRTPRSIETEFTFPGGESKKWLQFNIQPIPDGIFITFLDCTGRKRTEDELRGTIESNMDLANSLPLFAFEANHQGRIMYASPNLPGMLGYTQDDFSAGINVSQITLPENLQMARDRFKRIWRGEKPGPIEYHLLRKDGYTLPVLILSTRIVQRDFGPGVRAVLIDLSERRQMESAIKESERRYREVFDCASDAIFMRDLQGNIIEANESASALTGYSVDELMGMNASQFLTAPSFSVIMERQRRLIDGRITSQRYEVEVVKKDGTILTIEVVSRLMTENGQPASMLLIARDITEQKRLRRNMQSYISEITKAQEDERRRIARELHDETTQSLATLTFDIEALTRSQNDWSDEAVRICEQLRTRIDRIIDGVRRFSHELRPDVLDHLGLLVALESLVGELNKETRIEAVVEVVGTERRLLPDMELVLFRVAQEALHNVRKHAAATRAVVRIEFEAKKVSLRITDNGKGFEVPEILGDFAGKGKLGLIGMRERAWLFGGRFSVKSEVGKGTTVTVDVSG